MREGKSRANRRKVASQILISWLWRRRGKNSLGEAGQPISYFIWPSVEGETAPIQLRQDEWRWRFAFLGKPIMTYPLLSCRSASHGVPGPLSLLSVPLCHAIETREWRGCCVLSISKNIQDLPIVHPTHPPPLSINPCSLVCHASAAQLLCQTAFKWRFSVR